VYMRHGLQVHPADESDAEKAAERFGIKLYKLDIDEQFKEIVNRFETDYLSARTPNPCAHCNRKIKFGLLFDFAQEIGATGFATGHYAQMIQQPDGTFGLFRAADSSKDQSYLLYGIERNRLAQIQFPLGGLLKSQVRERAADLGLHVAEKKDSQEICFIEPHKHVEFLRKRHPDIDTKGVFVSTDGKILGQHDGYENFTIGQRKGMKVGFGKRIFVVKIDAESKNVVLGDYEELAVSRIKVNEINWLADVPADEPCEFDVKIRYRNEPTPATVIFKQDGTAEVEFSSPKHGVAPGQVAAFYKKSRLFGGGIIMQ
ncbi:MAG: tRNA 2-thiouridine(34) synthase MnmA, partial [Thermoguttaceae bacterium]